MDQDRRLIVRAGLGLAAGGFAATALPDAAPAAAAAADGGVPVALVAGSEEDQSVLLQGAIDEAADLGVPVLLPAGRFAVGEVVLRRGTVLAGAQGRTTLSLGSGVSILLADRAESIALLDVELDARGTGAAATLRDCRGILVRGCAIRGGAAAAMAIEGGEDVLVTGSRFADCRGAGLLLVGSSGCQVIANSARAVVGIAFEARGSHGLVVSGNLIAGSGGGIAVSGFGAGGRLAVIAGNLVRDVSGTGIAVEADASVTGNTIEGAAGIGIRAGLDAQKRDVAVTGNLLRGCGIGIGLSGDPAGGLLFVAQNMITGARDGAIRALDREKPIGPDLTRASAEAYPNLAVLQNIASR